MPGATKGGPGPIHLADSTLGEHRHVCAFFHNEDEEYRVLIPFILEGVETGDRSVHIVDPKQRERHLDRLRRAGIDVDLAQRNGQLEVLNWEDAYLREGRFDQRKMLGLIEEVLEKGKSQGFFHTRLIAQMEWSPEDRPGVNDLIEYEARLNHLLPRYPDPVI